MRITANMTADNALFNIQKGRSRLDRLQEEISSQMNVLRPSDDPISTRYILDLENKVKESMQYVKNIQNANLLVQVTDNSLGAMGDILTQAKSTVSNILGGSNDPTLTKMAVGQLTELKKQLLDQGNMQFGDQYIFGGFKNNLPPFRNNVLTMDATIPVGQPQKLTVLDTSNLKVGMPVMQPGTTIPPAPPVYVKSIDSAIQVTLTGNAPAPINGLLTFGMETQLTGTLNPASKTITNVDMFRFPNITVGMKVSDPDTTHIPPWIPPDTIVTAIDQSKKTITLSNPPTSAGTVPLAFALTNNISGKTISGNSTVYNIFDTSNLKAGMTVTGQGIPPNTTILSVDTTNQITLSGSSLQTIDGVMLTYGYDGANAGVISGDTVKGSNAITNVPMAILTNLRTGMPISGPGISPSSNITAVIPPVATTGDVSAGSNVITNIITAGLVVGMPLSSPNMPAGATVTAIDPVGNTVTFETVPPGGRPSTSVVGDALQFNSLVSISNPATVTGTAVPLTLPLKGDLTAGSSTISNIYTYNMEIGMTITGPGITGNTTIIGKTVNSLTLSQPATQGVLQADLSIKFSGNTSVGSSTVSNVYDTTGLSIGMPIAGAGIPADTTITSINPSVGPITGTLTLGSSNITGINTTGLTLGMPVTGTGIPPNVFISNVNSAANTVTFDTAPPTGAVATGTGSFTDLHFGSIINISKPAAAGGTGVLLDRPLAGNTQKDSKVLDGLFSTAELLVGMPIVGSTIPDGTVITAINSPTSISISNPATGTGKQIGISLAVDRDYTSYYGTDDDLNVEIDKGVSFTMNLKGGQLLRGESFPSGSPIRGKVDIIQVLDNLITAVATNNSASILKGVNDLKLSNDQINDAKAEVAGKMLRLDSAGKLHSRMQNTLKDLISQRQDLDMVKAGVEMTNEKTAFEAALSSTAKLSQLSLLDYLK